MDWIVFGDDWGVHPSTTQHLMLNVPPDDRVLWVNSIGMRSPDLTFSDARRVLNKAKAMFGPKEKGQATRLYEGSLIHFSCIQPKIIPFHLNSVAVALNARSLARRIDTERKRLGMDDQPVILSATPVIAQYAKAIPHKRLVYLRLDFYDQYPGCDPLLVRYAEDRLYQEADAIFVTAQALYPPQEFHDKTHYLAQGVDVGNFSEVDTLPSRKKVLGFFGTVSEWLDFELIERLAISLPDWTLHFVGKIDFLPERIRQLSNLRFDPPVPFGQLSNVMSDWAAAWVPFQINELTLGVNPLKIREYLAAGLPSMSTPLPEIERLDGDVFISSSPDEVKTWLVDVLDSDSREKRLARRESVRSHSWSSRTDRLRSILGGD